MKEKMKEKIEKFITKYDELFFIIIFLILSSGYTFRIRTIVGDEIWNFQNVYKMYNGFTIYKDANVIITPLFYVLGVILFKIFGANFFVFKFYNIVTYVILMLGIYKIFKKLKIKKYFSFLFSTLIFFILKNNVISLTSYNTLCMLFVIYGLLLILNKKNVKKQKYIILEGLLITLIILTKQNIGFLYLLAYIIYSIYDKSERKDALKIIGITTFLIAIFLIELKLEKILNEFINYTFLGLFDFGRKNLGFSINQTIILITMIIINIVLIYICNKYNIKEKKEYNIIAIFAFPLTLIAYPIFNYHHINFALLLHYILFFAILYNFIVEIDIKKSQWIFINTALISILLIISIKDICEYTKYISNQKVNYNSPYFGAVIDKNDMEEINNVTEFIRKSNKKVIDISPDAAFYNISLKRSNGAYDLLLTGNLGLNGENKIIEDIKNSKNTIYLISEKKYIYQESEKVKDYIKKNLRYVGKIEDLQIYETK